MYIEARQIARESRPLKPPPRPWASINIRKVREVPRPSRVLRALRGHTFSFHIPCSPTQSRGLFFEKIRQQIEPEKEAITLDARVYRGELVLHEQ